ncbi:ABC-type multidrug transport system, ATPase and permease component [Schinkia azotoformans MEV2011]|uniref:ABC-type multidrug transport system, ATPase and permease component n=1 Tax=Schinkia azotoformans MEV2011 TaxID=1348973 RepID=A0A072NF87_SCHAZ|nr:ABC transporter ATP-binding protein [Schinkia azotoformans]KEF36369.1 ABC-type multidrug transport system, ATPase and permease component [Schinkia azotoformans MEV2011]MEC1697310.1 ABC transporter ATP-binding protein [Schinkia azotoformans]MEC1724606.1 ABC transporter ATP-binding protein [Schinkia azotoformans]MEC1771827.1 ABC transporter ATP-binding protein [Schinkia azotoformans]MEC1779865.1 ABC transporter ATP-binding protein [Schinkia azotoformans]
MSSEAKNQLQKGGTQSQGPNLRPGGGGFGKHHQKPIEKPKNVSATLKRLWSFVGQEKRLLTTVFLCILIDAALSLVSPYLIGQSIDAMATENGIVNFGFLKIMVVVLLVAYIVSGALTFLEGWVMAGVSQRIVGSLREALFAKLQKLPVAFFDSHTHGELMSRLVNDIDNVSNSISQSITQLMSGIIILIGTFIMMLYLSPILTLASLITIPLIFLLTRTITKRTKVLFKDQQKQLGMLNGQIEETISGLYVIKAFNHEEKVIEQFDEVNAELRKVGIKAQIWSGFLMPIMNVIGNIGFVVVAIVGSILAVKSMITVGVIASFITYSRQFVRPLNELANIYNVILSGVAGAERVFEILDEHDEPEDSASAFPLKNPNGQVTFENVSFGYRSDVSIIKNISFEAAAGSRTALIGPTGAGKTTIVNLLTRFYDVTSGRILIDGRDIRTYTRDSLRSSFGIVLQDTYLFSGTIKENIKYGKPDATDEEVVDAAKMANADAFISRLPNKYDTVLAENGGNLSQGQKQLLAIARVILAKPAFLILDEATSSIDTRTEHQIQAALANVMVGRTSFIIAHRLNTIQSADTIMVIDAGEIIESGSHDELLAKKGAYYELYKSGAVQDVGS